MNEPLISELEPLSLDEVKMLLPEAVATWPTLRNTRFGLDENGTLWVYYAEQGFIVVAYWDLIRWHTSEPDMRQLCHLNA